MSGFPLSDWIGILCSTVRQYIHIPVWDFDVDVDTLEDETGDACWYLVITVGVHVLYQSDGSLQKECVQRADEQ